ncbi:hypothetical protein K9L97_02300 [Candidatus Woesearchaeota archaeon]|nr:hypothetical protein [Candidatus Woesearchaeota archaeon]
MEHVKDRCFLVKTLDCKAANNTLQYEKERPEETLQKTIVNETTFNFFY